MTWLIDVTLRSSVILLAALAACAWFGRRSAARRHAILAAGLFAAALVAPLTMVMPEWGMALPATFSAAPTAEHVVVTADAVEVIAENTPPAAVSASLVVTALWAAGMVIGFATLLLGTLRLTSIAKYAPQVIDGPWRDAVADVAVVYGIRRPLAIVTAASHDLIATWGLARPTILIPAGAEHWQQAWIRAAVLHELAHVRRGDWAIQIGATVVRTVFWFNPLVWLACARLRRESEHACDDLVLDAGLAPTAYADHLVNIARTCRAAPEWMPAMSMARLSTLERRVTAMLNANLDRKHLTTRIAAATLAVTAMVTLAVASFSVSAQGGLNMLEGNVYDMSGGVLPGVTVTLEDERQLQWSAVSDGMGRFRIGPVQSGRYTMQVSLPGFRSLRQEFELARPGDWTRAISLQLGEIEETVTITANRPAGTQASSQDGTFRPIRVGGNVRPPNKLKNVNPVYPPEMQQAGLEGVVPMEALIGIDGQVTSVRVLSAQVHPQFARAAEAAVRQWVFSATRLNNQPVEVSMVVTIRFSLSD